MLQLLRIIFFLSLLPLIFPQLVTAAPAEHERYIVVLRDGIESPAEAAKEFAEHVGGHVGFTYKHVLKGFSIRMPAQAIAKLKKDPRVRYVEPDYFRFAFGQSYPTGIRRIFANINGSIGMDSVDDYRVDVDVAVIDTGVDLDHPDLNVVGGIDCISGVCVAGGDDDNYHGTHVAGIIGAIDNGVGVVGVAPGARIWSVKVLDSEGYGYSSSVIAGIDWIAENANTIEVANMSLGGSDFSQAEYDAIQNAVEHGVAFAVAAGNSFEDANNYYPASFDNVLTVSALADFDGLSGGSADSTCYSDIDDNLARFSNWGSAIGIAAPGVCILSTIPGGSYGTLTGTSMASPHVAGALALLASTSKPTNQEDVYSLYEQVKFVGNYDWTDISGDGIREPLLDVSNAAIFNPTLVDGNASSDLIISALTVPSSAAPGATVTMAVSTKNTGELASAATTTSLYLSMDSAWDTADVILADVAVSALAAAATKTSSVSVTIPTTVAGTMYIIAKADSADEVAEGSETNNTTYRAYTFKPDLVISVLTGPSTTTPGTTIAMTVTTKNLGALSPSSTTGLYLSANTAWDAADTFLGDLAVSGLAFAATETGSISVMIPAAASGTMYIIAKADSAGIVTESSETNNTRYKSYTFKPDLTISVLTGLSATTPGATVTMTVATKNSGTTASSATTTSLYLSANSSWDTTDTLLGDLAVSALAAAATETGSVSVTIPVTASGTMYIIAKADSAGIVTETYETNNTLYRNLTVNQ